MSGWPAPSRIPQPRRPLATGSALMGSEAVPRPGAFSHGRTRGGRPRPGAPCR